MPRDRGGRTYRIRQIPSHTSRDSLARLLVDLCQGLGPVENIVTCSLASSLVPFETPRTKTATVIFKTIPELFDNDETEWVLKTGNAQPNTIVDVHFLGFTALNDVDSDLHVLDCISISGLASHPFGSWAERNPQSNFMWLRDRLPHDLKQVRSIIYGYDSRLVQSESFQGIDDIAISFIAHLKSIGRSLRAAKPAAILAHSLGGIILKCALLEMANGGDEEIYMLNSIREVIFFGVPNRGMEMEQWLPMVEGQPNEDLIRLLSPGSHYLIDLDERFYGISSVRNLRLVSFYETQRSQTAERNQSTGKWAVSGPFKVLVDKNSAEQRGSQKSDVVPVNKSHSDMVKFREGSEEYQIVAGYIHDLIKPHRDPLGSSREKNEDATMLERLEQAEAQPAETDTVLTRSLVRSLEHGYSRYRFEGIEKAYGPTFEWIWKDPNAGFESWLVNGTGTYWISGKPGSGKSTLMKYVFKNYQDMVLSNTVSSDRSQISAGFFFHDRGSHLQKSFEGLLYSILYQLLASEERLVKEISHIYVRRSAENRAKWSLGDLEEALGCILKQTRLPVDVLFFFDALDEYDGRPDFIVSFIKRMIDVPMSSATRVKICFSSRLWNIFIDEFQNSPGFKIHERTKNDILAYIGGKFNESPSMSGLLRQKPGTQDPGISALTSGLVEKAEGVFLWLKLVMDDLLNAAREGATVTELLEILASFPKELEELYTELVKRIPKEFRMESYAMLEIVLRSDMPVHPYDFWLATACASCHTIGDCVSKIPIKSFLAPAQILRPLTILDKVKLKINRSFSFKLDEVIGDNKQYQRRLKSRCGGLIEEVERLDEDGRKQDTVLQFMHQTVKDFVGKPGFRQLITNEDDESNGNGYAFLAKYGLAQLTLERRRISLAGYSAQELILDYPSWWLYLWYASKAESSTGVSQKQLLDAASEAFMPSRGEHDAYALFGSALSFGVIANLQLYVQECLSEDEDETRRKLMGHSDSKSPTLLHDVVRATSGPEAFRTGYKRLSKMANILLDAGANQYSIYHEMTPFQMLFEKCLSDYHGGYPSLYPDFVGVALAFLQHGQNPNVDIQGKILSGTAPPTMCKLLHIAVHETAAQVLLDYGADVNALDSSGLTPLDTVIKRAAARRSRLDEFYAALEHQLSLLLLDHGGCVTEAGASLVDDFLKVLSEDFRRLPNSFDDRLKNPPRLQTQPATARLGDRGTEGNKPRSTGFSLQTSNTSKSSRFKKFVPSLFKRDRP